MKNIYFIEAKSPGAHIFSRTPLPRLGSILLGTIFKNKGYNVKVFIEDIAPPAWNLLDDADMVCISSITSTANRAFQIAEKFKKRGVPVAKQRRRQAAVILMVTMAESGIVWPNTTTRL